MSNTRYNALCQKIDMMEDWKAVALCAVCAAKVQPVILRVGLPDTWRLVNECLDYVWSHLGQIGNDDDGIRLAKALESTPEWQCEDNAFLPFLVTQALDFVRFAVLAVAAPSSAKENAKGAFDLLVGIASSYDASAESFLAKEPARLSRIGLQVREEASQQRLVEILESTGAAPSETRALLQQETQEIAELFKQMLPMKCYEYVTD